MQPFQTAPQMPPQPMAPQGGTASPLAEALAKEGLMAPIQTVSPGPGAMRSAPPLGAGFMPAPPVAGMPGAAPGMPGMTPPGMQGAQPPAGGAPMGMPFQQMGGGNMGQGMPGATGQAGAVPKPPGMPFTGAPAGGPPPMGGAAPQQRPPFG